ITSFLFSDLSLEPFRLILRIIELGKAIGQFAPTDEKFETIGDERVIVIATCQWRDFCWIFGDEGWLNQPMLRNGIEYLHLQFSQPPIRHGLQLQSFTHLSGRGFVSDISFADVIGVSKNGLNDRETLKGPGEV